MYHHIDICTNPIIHLQLSPLDIKCPHTRRKVPNITYNPHHTFHPLLLIRNSACKNMHRLIQLDHTLRFDNVDGRRSEAHDERYLRVQFNEVSDGGICLIINRSQRYIIHCLRYCWRCYFVLILVSLTGLSTISIIAIATAIMIINNT